MKNGFVQLPIEVYDRLMAENAKLKTDLAESVHATVFNELETVVNKLIAIVPNWNDEPTLSIDYKVAYDVILDAFDASDFKDKYTMKDFSKDRKTEVYGIFKLKESAD